MDDMLTMSAKEVERLQVCEMLAKKFIKHKEAADRLNISARQTKRLLKRYRDEGNKGLISKSRGKPSNNSLSEELKQKIKTLTETDYIGFGPTLISEKLREVQGIRINKESLRSFMINWGLWQTKTLKPRSIHQQRQRRQHFGELIQIDGSTHPWFENRGDKCCLIVFIDDATSKIVSMCFAQSESTQSYFSCMKKYIKTYGIPLAFYSDRHAVFKVNKANSDNETQFGRAMQELGIETIYAHSPQAKGRVERVNRTLQDRLVKELRLKKISTIEEANNYLEEYRIKHNQRFGKKPMQDIDKHRKVFPSDEVLEGIFCERYYRRLSKNLEFSFESTIYQVAKDLYGLRDKQVMICRFANELKVSYEGKFIECKKFQSLPTSIAVSKDNKTVDKAPKTQPWLNVPFLRLIDRHASPT